MKVSHFSNFSNFPSSTPRILDPPVVTRKWISARHVEGHLGPIPNHPLHPTPTHLPLRSRGGSATLSAVPNQRVWSGVEGAIKPSNSESASVLTGDRSLPDRSQRSVSVRKHAVYKQFQQTSTDKLRCQQPHDNLIFFLTQDRTCVQSRKR